MELIHSFSLEDLVEWLRAQGQPGFRARQLWRWLYVARVAEWAAMTNLPQALRDTLRARFELHPVTARAGDTDSDGTVKILAGLSDGAAVETVAIPAADRRTLCVSSQVGCKFACAFCASGQGGFVRDLAAGEIVGQALLAAGRLGGVPGNIVVMGMGEPFDNYDNVLKAVRILNHKDGLAIGARRITISTSGVVEGIRRLAGEGLQVELSVSLHATDDALRSRLMPVNRRYPLADLIAACREYNAATGRIITFEYTLIRGLNDAPVQARQLAALAREVRGRVNLIPLSPVTEFKGQPSDRATIRAFADMLEGQGINVTLRESRGKGVGGACGQLRLRHAGGNAGVMSDGR